MERKCLFESKGGNKIRELVQIISGLVWTLIGFIGLILVATDEGGMSHSGYGGTWVYREAPGIEIWILVIILLVLGVINLCSGILSKNAYLKIYDDHIEAKSVDFFRLIIGGNGSVQTNIQLSFNEIQGVSIQKGMIVLDTFGKHRSIFCSDCNTAEKIILSKLKEKNKG